MVKISVVIPVYNSEKYVAKTIENILNQTFKEFELILVDDGSKDASGQICDTYAKKDKRIKVIHKQNGGICDARNKGLELAQGNYIMFSDNDDTMELTTLEENYNLITKNNADIVKFGRKILYIENEEIYRTDFRKYEFSILELDSLKEKILDLIYDKVLVCIWDGIYKKEILTKFDTKFKKGGEDIDFNLKILRNANKVILNDKIYYNHYIRKGVSTSTKYDENRIKVTKSLMQSFKDIFRNLNITDKEKYNIIQIRDYLNAILRNVNNPKCNLTKKEKKAIIQNMQFDFQKSNLKKMFKLSKKYTIEYILYRLSLYNILLILPKLKKK